MCLIVVVGEKGVIVPEGLRQAAYDNNGDGFGAIWFAGGGKIEEAKVLPKSWEDTEEVFSKVAGKVGAMHYRLTTKGETDLENVHPFKVCGVEEIGRDVYMCHNGTMGGMVEGVGEGRSDTWHFAMVVLRPMLLAQPDLLENASFIKFLEGVTSGNRVLLADGRAEKFIVLNKGMWTEAPSFDGGGVEVGKLLLSNTYSLRRTSGTLEYDVKTGKCTERKPVNSYYGARGTGGYGGHSYGYGEDDWWNYGRDGVRSQAGGGAAGTGAGKAVVPFEGGRKSTVSTVTVEDTDNKCKFGKMCKGCVSWDKGRCGTLDIKKNNLHTYRSGKATPDWYDEAMELVEFWFREQLEVSDMWGGVAGNGSPPSTNGGMINSEYIAEMISWDVGDSAKVEGQSFLEILVRDNPLGVSDYLRLWYKLYSVEWEWLLVALEDGEYDDDNPYLGVDDTEVDAVDESHDGVHRVFGILPEAN
jgi:hypothetical protein